MNNYKSADVYFMSSALLERIILSNRSFNLQTCR